MSTNISTYIRRLIFACIAILVPGHLLAADIYLTRGDDKGVPQQQAISRFQCSDTIIGVLRGTWTAGSEHLLQARWTDPRGKLREHTRYRFTAKEGQTRVWVWLRLHRGESDILERLLMQDDDSMQAFRGRWKVIFHVDGKEQKKIEFDVDC